MPQTAQRPRLLEDGRHDRWFRADAGFDATACRTIRRSRRALAGRASTTGARPRRRAGALDLLDQFPRNIFRATREPLRATRAPATSPTRPSRAASRARRRRCDGFFYRRSSLRGPAEQERAVTFSRSRGRGRAEVGAPSPGRVARFGRFPHRNATLAATARPPSRSGCRASRTPSKGDARRNASSPGARRRTQKAERVG